MAVAWIGNREASIAHAVDEAAMLLKASSCRSSRSWTPTSPARAPQCRSPSRSARVYDLADGGVSAVEAALIRIAAP